jgi:DNA polymerase
MDKQKLQYLQAMGIQAWEYREQELQPDSVASVAGVAVQAQAVPATEDDAGRWLELENEVRACQQCGLAQSRQQTVFGVGDRNARVMIVGEAPGADEDRQGEPFVGRAGQLLTRILLSLGYRREQVYIANILKCRPPNNRNPEADEIACCEPFLKRQIALIRPDVLVAVGGVAAQNLLKTEASVGQLRGRSHQYADTGVPVIVTYHPAYLLRSPEQKRKVWDDLRPLAAQHGNKRA